MAAVVTEPYFEVFVMDDEHPEGKAGFVCNTCRVPVDVQPCPNHAPVDVPGLDLVECEATPRHWGWVLANDGNGYGIPCFRCIAEEESRRKWEADACRHWAWRRWRITRWLSRRAYALGITSSGGGSRWGNGCNWCHTLPAFDFRQRPYILGVSRETWRCWLKGRHRRGEDVGLGFCGKCMPWPCCGSLTVDHVKGCSEDV